MKSISATRVKSMNLGCYMNASDNSGAKIVKLIGVVGGKSTKRRQFSAGIADLVKISVRKGVPEMMKQVFYAIVIRQKKEYRRLTGERISFADNAVVVLKDEKNPKGTQIKGPIAREVAERWPSVARLASIVV